MAETTKEVKVKKYRVINNIPDDNKDGFVYRHVNGKNYKIKVNEATELDESILSDLTNAQIYKVPGIVLTDESTVIDISRQTFNTIVSPRFDVQEV